MPTGSPYPPLDLPKDDLWGFLFERKDKPFPDDRVMLFDPYTKRSYTFEQTKAVAIDFGKGLRSMWEWQKGDVLALYTPNSIDTPAVMWGCHWAGGVVSPANPGYTAGELAFQLKDAGAKALVTQLAFLNTALEAAMIVGMPEERVILMGDDRDDTHRHKHFTAIRNLAGTSRYRRVKRDPIKDLAFLPYSSGTTGRPKGVMLTHLNVSSNTLMNNACEGAHLRLGEQKLMGCLPFYHIYGLVVILHQAFYGGYQVVVLPKFDLDDFCRIVQEFKVTFAHLVPPILVRLAKDEVVSKYNLSSIKMINSGAAPLTKELVEAFYARLKIPVKQGYGLSETSPTTHAQPWNTWRTHIGSVGTLLPNQTAKYMSPEEKEVPVGEVGELWIKGPNVFIGYLNNEQGTKNALTADGYFKTGDVGFQDKDDNFYITDRIKELIKYKGFQVPPAELEGLLLSHPKINDVAVIGIDNAAQATEVPRAYVVLKPNTPASKETGDEIIKWLAANVANHKRLRGGVKFVDEIPKSPSGKILRRVLKDRAAEEDLVRAKL